MVLSSKVAASTCLAFIFGMCWLVASVARPMVELPTPLLTHAPETEPTAGVRFAAFPAPSGATPAGPVVDVGQFARSSPVEVEATSDQIVGQALVLAEALLPEGDLQVPSAPPAGVAEAPAIAAVSPLPVPDAPVVVAEAQPPEGDLQAASAPPVGVAEAPVIAAVSPLPVPKAPVVVARQPASEARASADAGTLPEVKPAAPEAVVTGAPAEGPESAVAVVTETSPTRPEVPPKADWTPSVVQTYRVKRHDTLVKIMRRIWNSDDPQLLRLLLAANPEVARRRDRIFPGEVLNIPALPSTRAIPTIRLAATRVGGRRQTDSHASAGQAGFRWYTIRERDTLTRIARRLLNDEARWREIATLNQMRNADRILPGTRIKLPPLGQDT